jgi:hypothetical protein
MQNRERMKRQGYADLVMSRAQKFQNSNASCVGDFRRELLSDNL